MDTVVSLGSLYSLLFRPEQFYVCEPPQLIENNTNSTGTCSRVGINAHTCVHYDLHIIMSFILAMTDIVARVAFFNKLSLVKKTQLHLHCCYQWLEYILLLFMFVCSLGESSLKMLRDHQYCALY